MKIPVPQIADVPPKMPVIAVLAGNQREFDRFVYEKRALGSFEHYLYISSLRQLMGISIDSVHTIGTFMDRPDSQEIYHVARSRIGVGGGYQQPNNTSQALTKKNLMRSPVVPPHPNDLIPTHPDEAKDYYDKHIKAAWSTTDVSAVAVGVDLVAGNIVRDQNLTKSYIAMVDSDEERDNWNRALEIIYGKT
jgi:hypothetical protein